MAKYRELIEIRIKTHSKLNGPTFPHVVFNLLYIRDDLQLSDILHILISKEMKHWENRTLNFLRHIS
jgi:hypothetical protein